MIAAHLAAIAARIREDTALVDSTFTGRVAGEPSRYCVIYADSGVRIAERFTGAQQTATFRFTIHSVGTTQEQAQFVDERVFAQLLDFTPAIDGRVCRRIRHAASQPARRDTDVTPPLWFSVNVFELTSSPARSETP